MTMMNLYDGEDNTIFASDWPHHDFDHPRAIMKLPMPMAAKRRIMGENALELFGIPHPRPGVAAMADDGAGTVRAD